MPSIEFIYDADCPNVGETRAQLLRALSETNLTPQWQEWCRSDPDSPEYARAYGSPTVLVDGRDVAGIEASSETNSCRIYTDQTNGLVGVPPLEMITSAILRAKNEDDKNQGRWRGLLSVFPAVGVGLIPGLTCPACWPAYAGLLSALGLGFIDYTPYLLPMTGLFLIIALGTLGYQCFKNQRYTPLFLGIAGGLILILGKFVLLADAVTYIGISLLVATSLWNTWFSRKSRRKSCPNCHPIQGGISYEHKT